MPGGFEAAREALAKGRQMFTARTCTSPTGSLTPCPVTCVPGRFNVVQMAIGVRKRAASALPKSMSL